MNIFNKRLFPVVLHTDNGKQYGVTVPDLPGCFSGGDSIQEALACALEAIELHLEGLSKDGKKLPTMAPMAVHQKNPDFANGIWATVEINPP